jgi:hypothetical protein
MFQWTPLSLLTSDVRFDLRSAHWSRLATLNCDKTSLFFYPRLVPIHSLENGVGELNAEGQLVLPEKLTLTAESLSTDGVWVVAVSHCSAYNRRAELFLTTLLVACDEKQAGPASARTA